MNAPHDPTRRDFLKAGAALGAGLTLGFHVPFIGDAAAQPAGADEINAWVVVNPDDTVQGPHYLGNPFQREPEFGVASVNYKIAELLKRAKGNA